MDENYLEIVRVLPQRLQQPFENLPKSVVSTLSEIRLRAMKPIVLTSSSGTYFLTNRGYAQSLSENCITITKGELLSIFERLCDYSVYTHTDTLVNGYITMACGNRIGVCSSAVIKDNGVSTVKDISSLNFRIARQVIDCSEKLVSTIFPTGVQSLIIAGAPGSGKTTLMRDMCRKLSSGRLGKYYKVAIIDERREIACMKGGTCTNDVGVNTDVLDGFPKGKGIEVALRVLSPDVIVCDEVGSVTEVEQITSGLNSGVRFVLSVHASSRSELFRRPQIVRLLKTRQFNKVVLLGNSSSPGVVKDIIDISEDIHEIHSLIYN